VVVPVAYTYLDSLGKRVARYFRGADEPHEQDLLEDEKMAEVA
jgi:hypothetical protein